MISKIKKISLVLLVFVLCTSSSAFAAMTPTTGHKFSRGVGNCCYYIDSTAYGYESQIVDAANNWENTGYGWNPIYMTAVASNYATHMDFYGRTSSTDSFINRKVVAYTSCWYTDGTLVAPRGDEPDDDYFYTEIAFNLDRSESYDYRTAKHEMGHAFGLSHTTNEYSILYPNLIEMEVSTVQECDHNAINYLYN